MSLKKAQKIVNDVEEELGISLVVYQNHDLEYLKKKLEEFLDLDVDTEELSDPEELSSDDGEELDDDDSVEECEF